jgi:hypothetical protein
VKCLVCEFDKHETPDDEPQPEVHDAILEAVSIVFEAEIPLCYNHLNYANGFVSPTDGKCYWYDGMVTG